MKLVIRIILAFSVLIFFALSLTIIFEIIDPDDAINTKKLFGNISESIIYYCCIPGALLGVIIWAIIFINPETRKKSKFYDLFSAYGTACAYRKKIPILWKLSKISMSLLFGGILLSFYCMALGSII